MTARVWVRHTSGATREVAASAVPVMAPGGWRPLTDEELAEHEQHLAAEKAARVEAFTAASVRRAPAPPPVAPVAGEDGAAAPRRSGAKRRQDITAENEES